MRAESSPSPRGIRHVAARPLEGILDLDFTLSDAFSKETGRVREVVEAATNVTL